MIEDGRSFVPVSLSEKDQGYIKLWRWSSSCIEDDSAACIRRTGVEASDHRVLNYIPPAHCLFKFLDRRTKGQPYVEKSGGRATPQPSPHTILLISSFLRNHVSTTMRSKQNQLLTIFFISHLR